MHRLTIVLEQSRVSMGLPLHSWCYRVPIYLWDYRRCLAGKIVPTATMLRRAASAYRTWLIDQSVEDVSNPGEWRNLTGETHGRFTPIAQLQGSRLWLCKCADCGSFLPLSEQMLLRAPISCGCHIPKAQALCPHPTKPHKLTKTQSNLHDTLSKRAAKAGARLCARWSGPGAAKRCYDDCMPHRGYPWKRKFVGKVWGPSTMRWVDARDKKNVRHRYGKLLVIKRWNPGPGYPIFLCQCDCGRRLLLDRMRLRKAKRYRMGCSEECRSKIIIKHSGLTLFEWAIRNGIPYGFAYQHRKHGSWPTTYQRLRAIKTLWENKKHQYLIGVSSR